MLLFYAVTNFFSDVYCVDIHDRCGYKKDVGASYICLSQTQAFALPPLKDKQRYMPTPRYYTILSYLGCGGYNTLNVNVSLPYLSQCSTLRSLSLKDYVLKTSYMIMFVCSWFGMMLHELYGAKIRSFCVICNSYSFYLQKN